MCPVVRPLLASLNGNEHFSEIISRLRNYLLDVRNKSGTDTKGIITWWSLNYVWVSCVCKGTERQSLQTQYGPSLGSVSRRPVGNSLALDANVKHPDREYWWALGCYQKRLNLWDSWSWRKHLHMSRETLPISLPIGETSTICSTTDGQPLLTLTRNFVSCLIYFNYLLLRNDRFLIWNVEVKERDK